MDKSRHLRFVRIFFVIIAVWGGMGAFASSSKAQTASSSGLWRDVDEKPLLAARGNITAAAARRGVIPAEYRTLHLDRASLASLLAGAPQESSVRRASEAALVIELPIPGSAKFARFEVEESPIMEAGLAARYPDIRTYAARDADNPAITARLDLTPQGFHAMILSPGGQIFIDPYFADDSDTETTIVYYKRDYVVPKPFQCLVGPGKKAAAQRVETTLQRPTGAALRIYRLALAATAEYAAAVGGGQVDSGGSFISAGTVPGALASMVTTINRVDGVYERDLSIRMVLINNTDKLIYLNPTTDPYTNDDGFTLLDENQRNVDNIIGNANYDIGHVFSTGGGGVAGLGVVGYAPEKARGVTGSPAPTGDPYDIDYVSHEMGHQFGANHTFNGTIGNCEGNRNDSTAYEPGSGITIMAYAGICSDVDSVQDLSDHSDDYFHTASYDEIDAYTTFGDAVAFSTLATGNTPPAVADPTPYVIPISTPFALTASATDPDGDRLTYCWEEFDLGPELNAFTTAALDNGSSPIFRSFPPTTSPTRLFPSLIYILNNANQPPVFDANDFLVGEALPARARPNGLNFRCTVRDNRAGGGGSNFAAVKLTVAPGAGPFVVTAPNMAASLAGGSRQTVTWNVANTSAAPVACANVKISLSTDGGLTFPFVLADSVPNTGSAVVALPAAGNVATQQGRIKVEAVGNIFFDISDANLTITSTANTPPTFTANNTGLVIVRGTPTAASTTVGAAAAGASALSSVTVTGAPAGVTVTGSITNGNAVTLTGTAECRVTTTNTSRDYPVAVTVTDAAGSTVSGIVNLTIQPNPSPTLGDYGDATLSQDSPLTLLPAAGPADDNFNLLAAPFAIQPATLPGGGTVSVDQSTGAVTVSPTLATTLGTTAVRVTLLDECGAAAVKIFNVTVTEAVRVPPTINSTATSFGLSGRPFLYRITATRNPTAFSAAGLPPGLSLDAATGLITGTPTALGTFAVTLSATNAFGTSTRTLTLTINAPPPPLVLLAVQKGQATISSSDPGKVTVTLTEPLPNDLIVNYTLKGNAANGEDYVFRSGRAKIKAGRMSKVINVIPQGSLGGSSQKSVKFSLANGEGYTVGTAGAVRVVIRK